MTYTIYVIDTTTEKPIPGAAVSFVAADGQLLGLQVANDAGQVSFDDTEHPEYFFEGAMVRAEADGYYRASTSGETITSDWVMGLRKEPNSIAWALGGLALGVFGYRLYQHYRKRK